MRSISRLTVASLIVVAPLARAMDFAVLNTNDTGAGSLAQAITDANNNAGPDRIVFNIPGADIQKIHLMTQLPPITDPVLIDGYTQPGSTKNTEELSDNAVLNVEVDGGALGPNALGFELMAGSSTITGLVIDGFQIRLIGISSSNNVISGNFLGTDETGTILRMTGAFGVRIASGDLNRIGGLTPEERNVIAVQGASVHVLSPNQRIYGNFMGIDATGLVGISPGLTGGIQLGDNCVIESNVIGGMGASAINGGSNNLIRFNKLGTNAAGTAAVPNMTDAIGGPRSGTVIHGNLISGNTVGVHAGLGVTLIGNKVGTDITGTLPVPNLVEGISLAPGDTLGGVTLGQGNIIAFNGAFGVRIGGTTSMNRVIRGNSIFGNARKGISYGGDVQNDDCDADANLFQNYPVIEMANAAAGMIAVHGTLNSRASSSYALDFFANHMCDDSGQGEGETYLGSLDITTDATCNATFDVSFAFPSGAGTIVTGTATELGGLGNTSEFSFCSATPVEDAGVTEDANALPDATTAEDAASLSDAAQSDSTAGADAGSNRDAGSSSPADAGEEMMTDEGCTCSATASSASAWWLLFAVLALAARTRSRPRK